MLCLLAPAFDAETAIQACFRIVLVPKLHVKHSPDASKLSPDKEKLVLRTEFETSAQLFEEETTIRQRAGPCLPALADWPIESPLKRKEPKEKVLGYIGIHFVKPIYPR